MRAELHLIRGDEVPPTAQLTVLRLDDVQFGGLITALITYTQGELAGPPDHHELDRLRDLLSDIQFTRLEER